MPKQRKERPLYKKIAIDVAGFGLLIAAPLTGWLPGPGGIPLFIAGLGLLSLNHEWAERFLMYFERQREEFTDKYLMASPRVSRTIDIVCILIMITGAFLIVTQQNIFVRGTGIGLLTLTTIVLGSNQKRFERIAKWLKKLKH